MASPFTDNEMRQFDAAAERRVRDAEWNQRHAFQLAHPALAEAPVLAAADALQALDTRLSEPLPQRTEPEPLPTVPVPHTAWVTTNDGHQHPLRLNAPPCSARAEAIVAALHEFRRQGVATVSLPRLA